MQGMDICSAVGTNIRKLRNSKKLSQEELAFKAGIDRSYLSEVENGHKNVGITMLDQIADALGLRLLVCLWGIRGNWMVREGGELPAHT
jgi:transcriptional regulator with XRE-family HTH domain